MAKTISNRQKKTQLIDRLIAADIKTAEQVYDMTPAELFGKIPDITSDELRLFLVLQEVSKDGKLYNWICSE